jgi:LysM repeat protein
MKRFLRVAIAIAVLALVFGSGIGSAKAQGSSVYIVQYGDTLSGIAWRYGTTVQAIAALNSIANPSRIYAGQRLVIPATGGPVVTGRQVHVVQYGENLFRIGLLYGWDVNTMAGLNGLVYPYRIYAGQRLLIPQARYHTVQWGEYLSAIAARYGSTVGAIMAANYLYNPNLIYPGQILVIP